VLGVSVADLYAAAFGPGFLLAGLYIAYLMIRSFVNPKLGPPVPKAERVHSVPVILREVVLGVVPLVGLIAATLGSILAGWATPTEASGIGALGALILAVAYRKATLAGLKRALLSTMATSSMVLLLAVTSNIFGAVFARLGTANWITESLLALPLPPIAMLIMIVILIFLLGWPFEWPAIILVFLPIFYPVVAALKFDLIWFGALVAVVLQTAFLSPPVAMSAYYLKQVVKGWSLATIYKGMFQFMILQVVAIALIIIFPQIATAFPEYLQKVARETPVEQVEDKVRLEDYTDEYTDKANEATEEAQGDALEKSDEQPPGQPK
jgi:tripartite ATP-independent transporter DctM subunit